MLALDIERNGRKISLELPLPIDILSGELRAIGIHEPLNQIGQSEFALQPTNALGRHFMKLLHPEDNMQGIATCCREFDLLYGESRIALKELLMADRLKDLDHMASYLEHGPAALDHFIRLQLSKGHIDLPAPAEELREAAGESDLNEINLNDVHYHPLGEQGKKLLIALSPYESIAAANLACTLLTVPGVTAPLREVVASALRLLPQRPTETVSFICPLMVSVVDGNSGDLVEGDPDLLVDHEDEIRYALKDELPEGKNMADYLSDGLKQKVASVEWDVSYIQRKLYGKISCELRVPLSPDELDQLIDHLSGQASDGLGKSFEQYPVDTDDGELYVHLWHDSDDYFVMPSEDFFQQLHEQTLDNQGIGGMEGMS